MPRGQSQLICLRNINPRHKQLVHCLWWFRALLQDACSSMQLCWLSARPLDINSQPPLTASITLSRALSLPTDSRSPLSYIGAFPYLLVCRLFNTSPLIDCKITKKYHNTRHFHFSGIPSFIIGQPIHAPGSVMTPPYQF